MAGVSSRFIRIEERQIGPEVIHRHHFVAAQSHANVTCAVFEYQLPLWQRQLNRDRPSDWRRGTIQVAKKGTSLSSALKTFCIVRQPSEMAALMSVVLTPESLLLTAGAAKAGAVKRSPASLTPGSIRPRIGVDNSFRVGDDPGRTPSELGQRLFMPCSAGHRALLSGLSSERVGAIVLKE